MCKEHIIQPLNYVNSRKITNFYIIEHPKPVSNL